MARDHDLEPLLAVRQNQLSLLFNVSDTIDNKALAVLATDVAILLFMAQADLRLRWWGYIFCLVPLSLSLLLSIIAVWPREYSGAGVNLADHPEYLSLEDEQLVLQLLADTQASIEANKLLNATRLRFCVSGLLATGLATLTLLAILVV